jgi:hypothetical protein
MERLSLDAREAAAGAVELYRPVATRLVLPALTVFSLYRLQADLCILDCIAQQPADGRIHRSDHRHLPRPAPAEAEEPAAHELAVDPRHLLRLPGPALRVEVTDFQ